MSETIHIENAGPVESLDVPITDEGGIHVIRGMNDAGKTESLKAIDALLGGNAKIKKRYGTPQGLIEGLGATIKLMANARASGECEAVSLSGKLDIGTLIDPGLKDPVAADKARIKALLTVRGIKADLDIFLPLAGGDENAHYWLATIASDSTQAATDLVDMAARLKKDFEKEAREVVDEALNSEAAARAKRELAADVDLNGVSTAEILQGQLETAIKHEAEVKQCRTSYDAAQRVAEFALNDLRKAEASYAGPTVAEAAESVDRIGNALDAARDEVAARRKVLDAAMQEESRLETAHAMAVDKRAAAVQHDNDMAGWREAIEAAADIGQASDDDITKAAEAVTKARESAENGVRIRDAKKALAEAEVLQAAANRLTEEAGQLRDAAKGTADILAASVQAGTLLPVTDDNGNFRFAVKSENGDDRRIYYHELGPGRRTAIAAMEVASCLRDADPDAIRHALVVLPQPMWEGLDWEQRRHVWEHVKRLRINLATGECDKDPANSGGIRVEVFEP